MHNTIHRAASSLVLHNVGEKPGAMQRVSLGTFLKINVALSTCALISFAALMIKSLQVAKLL